MLLEVLGGKAKGRTTMRLTTEQIEELERQMLAMQVAVVSGERTYEIGRYHAILSRHAPALLDMAKELETLTQERLTMNQRGGFALLEKLGEFVKQTATATTPMTTKIMADFGDEQIPVVYVWATTSDKEPAARCCELAEDLAAVKTERDSLKAANLDMRKTLSTAAATGKAMRAAICKQHWQEGLTLTEALEQLSTLEWNAEHIRENDQFSESIKAAATMALDARKELKGVKADLEKAEADLAKAREALAKVADPELVGLTRAQLEKRFDDADVDEEVRVPQTACWYYANLCHAALAPKHAT